MENQFNAEFNGAGYVSGRDKPRLTAQIGRVFDCMKDGQWRTLEQISTVTGDPEASVSAQLRHLRKVKFGAHLVDRVYAGHGLYLYQVVANENTTWIG